MTGGIYQNSNADAEVVRPMPYLNVTNVTAKVTDAGGNYTFATGTATAALTGKYVKVTDSCGTSSLSTSTAPGNLAWGTSTGTDCTTPGVGGAGNTHAARTTYYHLSNWKAKASAWLPSNTWLQAQMGDKVNLNQTCNAYWDGSAVNFFKSGGGCSNTGELPTVFLHEAGHGLDSNDGSPSSTVGSSESYSDINALLVTHQSCVGVNFIPGQQCSGYGNACTACTGIRDADYAKHTYSTSPATPSQLSATTGFHCSKSSSYPGPCGYEGHCESYIMSEVGWDLAARDLPAAGIDAATSWMIADRLFFLTRPTAGEAYACPSITTTNGCGTSNWFTVYRVVDDEDGNLANGTPHAAAIYAAFNRHASACTTVVNTNSSSCPALAQPVLTATAGSGQVALSWPAVTNASKYLVLRNEFSATSGMTIMATVTTTSYTDVAVATGITYYYTIQAVGSNASCASAVAAVKSATPAAGTTYSISGTITLSGAGLAGVTVSTTGASTTTSSTGAYTLSGLVNGTYTVTPSLSGYTFSPTSTSTTISGANVTGINFTATQVTVTYSISGTVSGAIAAGVTMNLTGAATATTTTATGGTYTFAGLANGSYTVTPSLSGYTFSPASIGGDHQRCEPDGQELHEHGGERRHASDQRRGRCRLGDAAGLEVLHHRGSQRRHEPLDHADGPQRRHRPLREQQHDAPHHDHLLRALLQRRDDERVALLHHPHGGHVVHRGLRLRGGQLYGDGHGDHGHGHLQHLRHGERRRHLRRDHEPHGCGHRHHHHDHRRHVHLQRPGQRQLHGDAEPERLHLQPHEHRGDPQRRQPDGQELHGHLHGRPGDPLHQRIRSQHGLGPGGHLRHGGHVVARHLRNLPHLHAPRPELHGQVQLLHLRQRLRDALLPHLRASPCPAPTPP